MKKKIVCAWLGRGGADVGTSMAGQGVAVRYLRWVSGCMRVW